VSGSALSAGVAGFAAFAALALAFFAFFLLYRPGIHVQRLRSPNYKTLN
jgi:hypothetical protein